MSIYNPRLEFSTRLVRQEKAATESRSQSKTVRQQDMQTQESDNSRKGGLVMGNILLRSAFMRLSFMLALLFFSPFFANHAASAAYSFGFFFVQHRVYESPPSPVDRVGFALKDSTGHYVTDGGTVTTAVLKDSSGNSVSYTSPFFEVYREEDGSYDGTWANTALYMASDYGATLQGPLAADTYTLEASLSDGSKVTRQYTFNGEVDLPVISASTFGVASNASGDFCVQWQGVTSAQYSGTSQRAIIDFYSAGTFVAELFVTVPTDTHEVCIPWSVLKTFTTAIGPFDQAKFRLQLRTDDNNNRSYSNYYPIDLKLITSYHINSFFVQHRLYENSSGSVYRLVFTVADSTGNYVTDSATISGSPMPILRDSEDDVVGYTQPLTFEVYYEEDGSYDGTWTTTAPRYTASDYYSTLQGPLIAGPYTLTVPFKDGSVHSRQYRFNQEVNLPTISASTFGVTSNSSGDFCVQWQGVTSAQYPNTSQRAIIDYFSAGKLVAELFVTVPTDTHEVCIPRSVLKTFSASIGHFDQARFRVQIRTDDNNNRFYSNYYDLQLKSVALPFLQLLLGD
jgi:hypothetical protein